MKIIGAMLVKNEAGRYLERVLEQMRSICDEIVVLDDCSQDDTPDICMRYGATVWHSSQSFWGVDELIQRKRLWNYATSKAEKGDWILCLDADETIANIEKLPEILKQLHGRFSNVDAIAFPLYDMWDETHYRDDELWNAHFRYWTMCVKYNPYRDYVWREQELHCGRFPTNVSSYALCPPMKIQHWGWSQEKDREEKYRRYMLVDPDGKNGSLAQYSSILDPNPTLKEFI